MKIDKTHIVAPPEPGLVRKAPAHAKPEESSARDRVELSGAPVAPATDPSRSARIEELRAQVQLGAYHVPAEDIARAIVDEMLGGKTS
jgi:anti-sigma28 factor (negative regulator of flagellin synthesis)